MKVLSPDEAFERKVSALDLLENAIEHCKKDLEPGEMKDGGLIFDLEQTQEAIIRHRSLVIDEHTEAKNQAAVALAKAIQSSDSKSSG